MKQELQRTRRYDWLVKKIQSNQKLTKKEEHFIEDYDNTHTDNEFNIIVSLGREMTTDEKAEITMSITKAISGLGYDDYDIN